MSRAVLKRRSLLKQLGAAAFLATPVFRSVFAEAQGQSPVRLVLFHMPSGVSMESLNADYSVAGSMWTLDHLLAPLKEIEGDILQFRGLGHQTGEVVSSYNGLEGHGGGMRTVFTGSTDHNKPGAPWGATSSIDQLVANAIGQQTKFGSLQLGVITTTNGVAEGRRCLFNNGVPLEPVEDPQATFSRLFPGGVAPGGAPTMAPDPNATAELLYQHATGKSRLDQLRAEVMAIKAVAGADEQAKLDLHLTSLRELESSLPSVGGGSGGMFLGVSCQAPNLGTARAPEKDAPVDQPADYIQELGPVMQELLYQALNCDLTRVGSFQWMSSGENNIYPFLGISTSHHNLEHGWREDAKAKADYDKIQGWLMGNISNFIKRLKATPEGAGSMLDNTVVLVASEMWGEHSHEELIALVAGKAGGKIRTGRTIDAQGRAHNDLLLSLVNAVGLNVTSVGDPKYVTGPLSLG